MGILVERGNVITLLCNHLKAHVTELKLVKPYHGELDRYSKKVQIKESSFPAQVNLTTPFALVISKTRERIEGKGASLRYKHDLSIYIGESNNHNFNSTEVPSIFSLLDKCVNALNGKSLLKGAGELTLVNDGEYLITTDQFVIYDQKYYQLEIGL